MAEMAEAIASFRRLDKERGWMRCTAENRRGGSISLCRSVLCAVLSVFCVLDSTLEHCNLRHDPAQRSIILYLWNVAWALRLAARSSMAG